VSKDEESINKSDPIGRFNKNKNKNNEKRF
jgi:hypothetical protein